MCKAGLIALGPTLKNVSHSGEKDVYYEITGCSIQKCQVKFATGIAQNIHILAPFVVCQFCPLLTESC